MATVHRPRYHPYWEETECLSYYEMLSLHEVFEVIGSQLTETDVEVMSFLLDETHPGKHPLDPEDWTEEILEDSEESVTVTSPNPRLVEVWRRLQPRSSPCPAATRHKPKSGIELLLELERRGYLSEGNLEPLLQLLRILTRHDLLPFVSRKKRRTVSPERNRVDYAEAKNQRQVSSFGPMHSIGQMHTSGLIDPSHDYTPRQWRAGVDPSRPKAIPTRRKRGKGQRWSRRAGGTPETSQPIQNKVSCDIRLRVRAEYLEHESALRGSVSSDKQQPLERQFELFSRANTLLRTRDLGSIICDIKFTELANLDAFWGDYLSGTLLEALKGVFITDSLKRAAGQEGVRLLVSVDQDDYEEGRRVLLDSQGPSTAYWGMERS